MRFFFKALLWLTISAWSASCVWAADAPQSLLIVRSEGFFPPHEMLVNGQLTGAHIDLIQAAAASLSVKVVFETYPWVRAIAMVQGGQADAISYMGTTPEREAFGYFEEGNRLSKVQNGFFGLKATAAKVAYSGDMNQLRPYSIGHIRGRRSYPDYDAATFLNKDEYALDEEQLLNMLVAGRFDFGMAPISRVKYIAQTMGLEGQLDFLQPYGPTVGTYLVFSKAKGHAELAKRFADAMVGVKKSPKFQEILKKYKIKASDF